MKQFMLSRPNSGFGSSKPIDPADQSRGFKFKALTAAMLSIGLTAVPGVAAEQSPSKFQVQTQSGTAQAVQPQVNQQTAAAAAEKRKQLLSEAAAAITQTQLALKALEEKKVDVALKTLTDVTGKLELIVARDPSLKLAPIATDVTTLDVFAHFLQVDMIVHFSLVAHQIQPQFGRIAKQILFLQMRLILEQ